MQTFEIRVLCTPAS